MDCARCLLLSHSLLTTNPFHRGVNRGQFITSFLINETKNKWYEAWLMEATSSWMLDWRWTVLHATWHVLYKHGDTEARGGARDIGKVQLRGWSPSSESTQGSENTGLGADVHHARPRGGEKVLPHWGPPQKRPPEDQEFELGGEGHLTLAAVNHGFLTHKRWMIWTPPSKSCCED